MTKKPKAEAEDDDLRPEYDFSKMKLVGRGIFAERYRAGTKVILLGDDDVADEEKFESGFGTESNGY